MIANCLFLVPDSLHHADETHIFPDIVHAHHAAAAFYRKSCIGPVSDAISRGDRKIKHFYRDIRLTVINENKLKEFGDDGSSFFNLNTPHDVEKMILSQEVR